jgi:hypothetical protein
MLAFERCDACKKQATADAKIYQVGPMPMLLLGLSITTSMKHKSSSAGSRYLLFICSHQFTYLYVMSILAGGVGLHLANMHADDLLIIQKFNV